ncbi:hypothetical protein DEU56DRAFT_758775 [Suillus clintonianus]|uniref:uncharacterized protein n=1 Tax=Suillus clintonianus TaxID=1904413 RepID=UPI001B880C5E|nr:uncharacterized protein DEU56DRAFT_758775 [Suillus clintonianus]KAG2126961.1 hypothetical protein DEU56DRAFT_758775 [Suillus clintonianus]
MLPSTPPRRPHHSSFDLAGSTDTSGRRPNSPPSSPSLLSMTGSATSTTSDAEDKYPLTPNSKGSGGACRIANTSEGVGSPTPSHSTENQHSDAPPPDGWINSSEDHRVLDRLLNNIVCDQGISEIVEQKVKDAYLRHLGRLNANYFHRVIHLLEAIRERERMRYFVSCWDIAVVQRWEAVAVSASDTSKSDFVMVERELGMVLDILSQRLSLPRVPPTDSDSQHLLTARDNDRRSVRRADDVLGFLQAHAPPMEKCLVDH